MPGEQFTIGAHVLATDGECGKLARVIVDPVAQRLTHLVVAPKHHDGFGRMAAVELVEAVDASGIRLTCTLAEFEALENAEDVQFMPADTDLFGYGTNASMWPYFSLANPLSGPHHQPMYVDRVPAGEVEVHRGDAVHASDGWIGSVEGLVVDPSDHHVTHVLLAEGHLWGRKQVAIPIGTASRVGEEIRVGLTKAEVEALPEVELGR